MSDKHIVTFHKSGRGKAQCPSNPAYPDGMEVRIAKPHEKSCSIDLPYPAQECGMHLIHCTECGMDTAITAAGRPDDPKRVIVPCRAPAPS